MKNYLKLVVIAVICGLGLALLVTSCRSPQAAPQRQLQEQVEYQVGELVFIGDLMAEIKQKMKVGDTWMYRYETLHDTEFATGFVEASKINQ